MPYKDPYKAKEYSRQWRLKNKEKHREYNRQYCLRNKKKSTNVLVNIVQQNIEKNT